MGVQYYYDLFNFNAGSLILGLFGIVLISFFVPRFLVKGENLKQKAFFNLGLKLHLFAGLAYCLYHQFSYKGGDIFSYYAGSAAITEKFGLDIFGYFGLLIKNNLENDFEILKEINLIEPHFALQPSLFMTLKLFSILNYLAFNNFYASNAIASLISFLACWNFYLKIVKLYPNVNQSLFRISIIFYPSVLFWGSAISKDAICITCLFILFSKLIDIIIFRKSILKNLLFAFVALYILTIVKSYIAIVLVPSIFIWIASNFIKRINIKAFKKLIFPIIFIASIIGGLGLSNSLTKLDNRFSGNDSFAEKAKNQQTYLQKAGSAYSLGIESNNILVIAPLGIVATLFRPFIWEVSNPFMVLAFFESFVLSILIFFVFFKWGFKNAISFILNDNFIVFSLIFTLVFSAGIGSSSGNFGTLVRYKIPCLPFFSMALLLMFNQYTSEIPYKFQSTFHKFLAKYLLGQKAPIKTSILTSNRNIMQHA